jgi:hypothetical protein
MIILGGINGPGDDVFPKEEKDGGRTARDAEAGRNLFVSYPFRFAFRHPIASQSLSSFPPPSPPYSVWPRILQISSAGVALFTIPVP